MQITNPVNAPLETLDVAADYLTDVVPTYSKTTGRLTLSTEAILGCVYTLLGALPCFFRADCVRLSVYARAVIAGRTRRRRWR